MPAIINLVAVTAVGSVILWRLCVSIGMRKRLGRALFKLGYLLYTNTRCGKWFNDRNIRKARVKYGEDGHSTAITYCYGSRGTANVHDFDISRTVQSIITKFGIKITPVPFSFDNYSYVVVDTATGDVVVIDAGDGMTIHRYLEENSLTPKAILTTHKHWDHCAGNGYLVKRYPNLSVYGSAIDLPDGITKLLGHEEKFSIGSLDFVSYYTPGHTKGHVIYLLKGEKHGMEQDHIFTGDLLFLAGCGKMFEGTGTDMLGSLDLVCTFPESTLVWPGHEYAVTDLIFALTIVPDSEVVRDKLIWARQQRSERLPTCPSTLKEEKEYNLFLRSGDLELHKILGMQPLLEKNENAPGTSNDNGSLPSAEQKTRLEALGRLRMRKDKM